MSLRQIASNMKRRAVADPGTAILPETPLSHGARVKLKYDAEQYEFRLQVQRSGPPPVQGSEPFSRWLLELKTFARFFEAGAAFTVTHQTGKQSYAAVITWLNEEAMNKDYAAWAGSVSKTAPTPASPIAIDENDPIARAAGRLAPGIQIASRKGQSGQ